MSPARRHPSKYPHKVIVKFSKIVNQESSAQILDDFQLSKPSFFTLKGITFSDKPPDSHFPACLLWAAFLALQCGFAPLLTSMDNPDGSFDFLAHVGLLDGLFDKLEANLPRITLVFMALVSGKGGKPAAWYLDEDIVGQVLAASTKWAYTPWTLLCLPYNVGTRKTEWLVAAGEDALRRAALPPQPVICSVTQDRSLRDATLQDKLASLFNVPVPSSSKRTRSPSPSGSIIPEDSLSLVKDSPPAPLSKRACMEPSTKPMSLKASSSMSRTTRSGHASFIPRPPMPPPQPAPKAKSKASAKAAAKPKASKAKAKPKGKSKAKAKVVAIPLFELKDEPDEDLLVALLARQPRKIPTWFSTKSAKVLGVDIATPGSELMVQDTPDNANDGKWEDEGVGSGGEEWEDSHQGEGSPQPLVSAATQTLEGVYPPQLKMTAKRTGGRPLCCCDKTPTREALMITRNDIPKHKLLDSLFRKLMSFSPDKLTASLDSEKYQTLVLDFQQNRTSKPFLPYGKSSPLGPLSCTYKHPFKVDPSWGLTPELCRLDKIPLINAGSNSYTASNLIHVNRPSNIALF
ncbi:hypothetical protein BDP27DRAFT_1370132 [Rhodocollybia butyracea]|uniref:Uncharacterized protein n=1 Tax=Rhodocollybia butyracea TaxID=206335 RepID=A0A9P5PBP3_9AGAR|nr:hypothetical protein BDP27DRAFT_1370132 [Rhodocollybia butyracea]